MILFENTAAILLGTAFLGLCVGSFLNVVIHRLPLMMERDWQQQCACECGQAIPSGAPLSLSAPRSRCPNCGHQITALENIPVLSYLFLRGRCSGCAKRISPRYPLIESLTCLFSVFTVWHFGATTLAAGALLLGWCLIALTFIDFDTQLLPDSITLPLLWLGLLLNLSQHGFIGLPSAVLGAVLGYLSLWSIYWLYKLATGKEGMGYGDFKLLAALGAWFGWKMLPSIILLSSLAGACVGIFLIFIARRGRSVPIPFGPYLAATGMLTLFWGKEISRYFGMGT